MTDVLMADDDEVLVEYLASMDTQVYRGTRKKAQKKRAANHDEDHLSRCDLPTY